MPLDLFVEKVETGDERLEPVGEMVRARTAAEQPRLLAALELLMGAARPVVLVGGGCVLSEAEADVRALVERLHVPAVSTPLAAGVLAADHPLYFGNIGRNGAYAANEATRGADVILALGVRFDDRMSSSWIPGYTFSIPPTKLIQVDVDPSELGRNYPVAVGVLGDARTVVRQLLSEIQQRERVQGAPCGTGSSVWHPRGTVWEADRAPLAEAGDVPLHPERVVATLSRLLDEHAIVLSDVGVHHNWLVQRLKVRGPRSFLQSWGFGSMGFAVCGVVGAKLAAPERPAIAVCGDGGFLMAAHSVATAVEYHVPAVWVVWNNGGYVSIRDLQFGAFGPRELATRSRTAGAVSWSAPTSPRWPAPWGRTAIESRSLATSGTRLAAALASNGPSVLDVPVQADERPVGTGGWVLPPLEPFAPTYRVPSDR